MEESHERLKSWSELPSDLLNSLLERLSFADFLRAKSVCWSWYSASRQCVPKNNHIPWLLLFPEDNSNSSCTLFNPEEKDKLYRTQDLDLELPRRFCLKSCGSWLLMQNRLHNLYVVNLFTKERINLPPVESQDGTTKLEPAVFGFRITLPDGSKAAKPMHIRSPVFWIDDKTKDYVVSWGLGTCCVVYSKKGYNSWTQIPEALDCCDMVYKDHKLYFLSYFRDLRIYDFSGEIPQQSFCCTCAYVERFVSNGPRRPRQPSDRRILWATKLVVTVTGDVLKVETILRPVSRIWSFRLFKICSLGLFKRVRSLGEEAMLLDLGITVLANNSEGICRNSIYFNGSHNSNSSDIFLFNLETRKMEQLHKFDLSSDQLSGNRWFLPSFTQAMA
ncbi:putative F-box protein [Raphanus sativus]|uniref:Probable F-box protein At4g22165 n=1 Tax=Raphanus sativus TaxID=3726 RepID=A0A6J0LZC1_RAPSA|nr:probable F-box protein At4g22165 [Raphanus sativus]KAJ4910651.1 putative F-box protein [Raphanus sativus]